MDRKKLDIDHNESATCKETGERRQRVVAEMLVIDRVELDVVEEATDVRRPRTEMTPSPPAARAKPVDEAVQVGDVCEHVVGDARVRISAAALDSSEAASSASRNSVTVSMPRARRRLGHVARRLDADHRNPRLGEELQEVSVVARHLHHEGVRPELATARSSVLTNSRACPRNVVENEERYEYSRNSTSGATVSVICTSVAAPGTALRRAGSGHRHRPRSREGRSRAACPRARGRAGAAGNRRRGTS